MSNFENLSDSWLCRIAGQMGLEEQIVMDGDGGLANRDEMIDIIKAAEGDDRK